MIKLADLLEVEYDVDKVEEPKYQPTEVTRMVQDHLIFFQSQHEFDGTDWHGIELLCYRLAELTREAAIESVGWYKYPSSQRFDQDGKNWRYVLTRTERPVTVNCHSMLHNNVWTLNTTIYDTDKINRDRLKLIEHDDVWKRSMLWTIETAKTLQTEEFDYSTAMRDFEYRLGAVDDLYGLKRKIEVRIKELYRKIFHTNDQIPDKISLAINTWNLPEGKVAIYRSPQETGLQHATITVAPKILKDHEYVEYVLTHELIHAAFGHGQPHDDDYQQLADLLGVPKKYQD